MSSQSQSPYNVEDLKLLKSILRGSEGVDRLDPHLLAELQRKLDKMYESPVKWIELYLKDYANRLSEAMDGLMVSHGDNKGLYATYYPPTQRLISDLDEFIDLVADFKELEDDN